MRASFGRQINLATRKIKKAYKNPQGPSYGSDPVGDEGDMEAILHLRRIQRIFNSANKRRLNIERDVAENPSELNLKRKKRSDANMVDCIDAMAHANSLTSGIQIEPRVRLGTVECKTHDLRC